MAEKDFEKTQLPFLDTRTYRQKIIEILVVWGIEITLFSLLLVSLSIKEALYFLIFHSIVVPFIIMYLKLPSLNKNVKALFNRNKTFANSGVVVLSIVYPLVSLSNPYLIHLGAMVGIYAILALGLNVVIGYVGLLDLGYAAFYAIGAYASTLLSVNFNLPFWFTLPLAAITASIFGVIIGMPALRVRGHYLALVTLAFGVIVYLLLINLETVTNGTIGIMRISPPKIGNFSFFTSLKFSGITFPYYINFYYLILIVIFLIVLLMNRLQNSRTGRAWESIREDEIAASSCGVNITKYKLLAFATGAFLGGVAGVLFAHMIGYINPENFTFGESLTVVLMVILGGSGNIRGVLLGAAILTLVPERLRELEHFRLPLFGTVMLLLMLYRPQGILPRRIRQRVLPEKSLNQTMKNEK